MVFPYVVYEQLRNSFSSHFFGGRHDMGLFRVSVDYDENAVESLAFWQVDYEVACNLLPWFVRDFIWSEATNNFGILVQESWLVLDVQWQVNHGIVEAPFALFPYHLGRIPIL